MSRSPEEVVLGFLLDVRSGERPERVHDHLARWVVARQGRPGAKRTAAVRDPDQHVRHVREMLSSVGPWTLQVLHLTACGDLVEASWRQTGRVVEHGGARYRVEDDRIIEYWIEFRHDVASPGGALR
ncbi:nuclear transport factor 2 family protein [Modestobacter sp. I12A-02662]|uniref:nuclear transport factor 2 family protein n=1 Tax=Modestobacter sp. I12A-02662 TaxID=1730496 RepID=UPI0034DFCA1D